MMLSVIIPTHNREATLMQTLDALQAQTHAPDFEVIVVDNASSDGTQAMLAQRRDPFLLRTLFEGEPNRARARNAGIDAAQGEIVVFIDDDVLAPPQFLSAHAVAHRGDGAFAVTGPIMNVISFEHRPRPGWKNLSRAFFCTCNASVSLAALRKAGGFDERFNRYGWEDTELGVRLRHDGLTHRFAWDAYVHHLKPPGWESLEEAERRMREKARMAVLFTKKQPEMRVRLATGNYRVNRLRGALLAPAWLQPFAAKIAEDGNLPHSLRAFARGHYLDGVYIGELRREGAAQ